VKNRAGLFCIEPEKKGRVEDGKKIIVISDKPLTVEELQEMVEDDYIIIPVPNYESILDSGRYYPSTSRELTSRQSTSRESTSR